MASTTILSAHFEFSSVNLGYCVYETPMIAQEKWTHIWKALIFLAANDKCPNSLRLLQIFECVPRISCMWNPNDRTVKVDIFLKSPKFSASNGKYYNSLCVEWLWLQLSPLILDFRMYTQGWGYETNLEIVWKWMRHICKGLNCLRRMLYTQASHSTLVWITERNKIDSWVVTVAVWIIFYHGMYKKCPS